MYILITLLIGAVVGWVASLLWKGSGSGLIMNIILGIAGAYVGQWLFDQLNINISGRWASFFTAVVGAFVLLWIKSLLFNQRKV